MRSESKNARSKPARRINLKATVGLTLVGSLLFAGLAGTVSAWGAPTVENTSQNVDVVFDSQNLVSDDQEQTINNWSKELYEKYGVSLAVEFVKTTDGPIKDWTVKRANELGVGSSDLDNGLFYGIALDDRSYFVAKGSGYSKIPDYKLQEILDDKLTPRFKEKDYAGGVIESSRGFGELTLDPNATVDTKAEQNERVGKVIDNVLFMLLGVTLIALLSGLTFRFVKTAKAKRELEEKYALQAAKDKEEARKRDERRKLIQKIDVAVDKMSKLDFFKFARLSNTAKRSLWIQNSKIQETVFRDNSHDLTPSEQINLIEKRIASMNGYSSVTIAPDVSLATSISRYEAQKKKERLEAEKAEKARRERRAAELKAKDFWRSLPSNKKKELAKIRSKSDREKWVASNGGSDLMNSYNPAIFMAIIGSSINSYNHQGYSGSSSSSYSSSSSSSSSSYSSYSSSSFGGGSFDGGGGGGSW